MTKKKKDVRAFLEEVIVPIEKKRVDNGNLYVLIRSYISLNGEKPGFFYQYQENERDNYSGDQWALPLSGKAGKWQEIQPPTSKRSLEKFLNLTTLSGILWHGGSAGNLYRAEYEGESKMLEYDDFSFTVKINLTNEQKMELDAQEYIDKCVQTGIKVKKARLVSRVKEWTPFLLWSFLIDCTEHCYSRYKVDNQPISDLYRHGIVYARALSRYLCDMSISDMEEIIVENADYKGYILSEFTKTEELKSRIRQVMEEDVLTKYVGKAVLECLDNPHKPFVGISECRNQNAWSFESKYCDEYEIPSFFNAKGMGEERILKRIWFALLKEELDWQVSHLIRLIEQES